MSGPEHYTRAEALLRRAHGEDAEQSMYTVATAQVHATLALAAATALPSSGEMPIPDHDAWHEVAGVKAPLVDDEDLAGEARCRVCGCTESQACEGGCHWVPDPQMGDLCSRCAPDSAPAWLGEILDQWNAGAITPHDAMTTVLNRLAEKPEGEPEAASDIDDDDPKTWTDGEGRVWDLRFKYADRLGNLWHYAGGFEYPAGIPVPLLSRDDWSIQDVRLTAVEAQWGPLAIPKSDGEQDTGPAAYPAPGSEIPGQPGYVVGTCAHRVAASEWRAGYRTCERCHIDETAGDES